MVTSSNFQYCYFWSYKLKEVLSVKNQNQLMKVSLTAHFTVFTQFLLIL